MLHEKPKTKTWDKEIEVSRFTGRPRSRESRFQQRPNTKRKWSGIVRTHNGVTDIPVDASTEESLSPQLTRQLLAQLAKMPAAAAKEFLRRPEGEVLHAAARHYGLDEMVQAIIYTPT